MDASYDYLKKCCLYFLVHFQLQNKFLEYIKLLSATMAIIIIIFLLTKNQLVYPKTKNVHFENYFKDFTPYIFYDVFFCKI